MAKLYAIEYNNGEAYEDNYHDIEEVIYQTKAEAEQGIYEQGYTVKVIERCYEDNKFSRETTEYIRPALNEDDGEDCSSYTIRELKLKTQHELYEHCTRDELIQTIIELEDTTELEEM